MVCNFLPVRRDQYRIGVPEAGIYAEVFSTDRAEYGGSGLSNGDGIKTEEIPMHGCGQSVSLTLPPLSTIFLKCRRHKPKSTKAGTETTARKRETGKKNARARKEGV